MSRNCNGLSNKVLIPTRLEERNYMKMAFAALALTLMACAFPPQAALAQEGDAPEGYERILQSWNGRYHKGGWNHYGPGY